jgi:hypothetical protein
VYGLNDASYIWYESLKQKILKIFGAQVSDLDPCLFFVNKANCKGLIATQVDDLLMTGDQVFQEKEQELMAIFEMKAKQVHNFTFSGLHIVCENEKISIDMDTYIEKIFPLSLKSDFKEFRKIRGKLLWLSTNYRPDIAFQVASLIQVTENIFENNLSKNIRDANDLVAKIHATKNLKIIFQKLNLEFLKIVVYADASFANNLDLSSQLGFLVMLMDDSKKANILAWKSAKSQRVVHSTLAAETLAMSMAFDLAFGIRKSLVDILKVKIDLVIFTDNKGIFDTITKRTSVTEKRVMIELAVLREAYEKGEISNMGFILSKNNPADALTKNHPSEHLLRLMSEGTIEHPVEQWLE